MAPNAPEARARLAEDQFDAVLLDIGLPGMSGIEEDQIRLVRLGRGNGGLSAPGLGNNLEPGVAESRCEARSKQGHIVHNEESLHISSATLARLLRLNHPEIAVPPVVEHRLLAGVSVEEDEEVMSEHLHLQCSLLDRHRPQRESLLPHNNGISVQ